MKKLIPAIVILVSLQAAASANGLSIGPSPWIGNTPDGLMKGLGLEVYYYASEKFSYGITSGYLQLKYPVGAATYQISYIPAAAGFRYHFLNSAFDDSASLIAGGGLLYNHHLSEKAVNQSIPQISWNSPMNLYLQLGIKTEKKFSELYYFDIFIQYNKSLSEFASASASGLTTTYYMDVIIISMGAGISISLGGK